MVKHEFMLLKEIPGRKRRKYGEIADIIDEMLEKGEECVRFECENEKERNSLYQTIYATSVRRHKKPISRYIRGNSIYVVNEQLKEKK